MSKKFLKIVMSLMLALAVVPSVALAEEEPTELTATTATEGTLSAGSYILKSNVTLNKDLTIATDTIVTIDLNGYTLTGSASVITVNGTLTIKDTSDDADGKITNGVTYKGTGVKYGEGESSSSFPTVNGGGVYVSGTLNLLSGSISDNTVGQCYGAGVYVDESATFNMSGGSISGNYTVSCGTNVASNKVAGGGVYNAGTFNMTGGTISSNKLIWWDGTSSNDVGAHGAGIYNTGTFTMSGGSISGNVTGAEGAGIYSTGNVTITGGEISANDASVTITYFEDEDSINPKTAAKTINKGAGIYMNGGTLDISGGSIKKNVSYGSGGGIFANNATVSISGNALIDSNTSEADGGGGIYLSGKSTITMSGGTISNNATPNGSGGGVWVNSTSTFSMSGGTISYNSVGTSTNGKKAAGVGVNGGTFTMTGGTITGNYTYTGNDTLTNGYGGGIWVGDGAGTVTINGGSVYGNTARWGAGITSEGGTVNITSGVVANNTATLYASDIYAGLSGITYTTLNISDDVNESTTYEAGTMNLTIDGWYVDGGTDENDETIRYSDGTDEVLDSANYTDKYTFTTATTEDEETDDESEDLATSDSDTSTSNPSEYTITNGTTLTETVYLIAAHGIGYKVTYNDNVEDEEVFEDQVSYVKSGSAVPGFEGSTARTGYTFLGWSLDGSTVIDLSTMTINEDVTFYAVWEEVTTTDDTDTDDTENTDDTDTTEDTDNTDSGSDTEITDDTETGDTGITDESGVGADVTSSDDDDSNSSTTTAASSDTEESADTDTSDNTVMYIYALVGLTAACGAYYVARRKEEL